MPIPSADWTGPLQPRSPRTPATISAPRRAIYRASIDTMCGGCRGWRGWRGAVADLGLLRHAPPLGLPLGPCSRTADGARQPARGGGGARPGCGNFDMVVVLGHSPRIHRRYPHPMPAITTPPDRAVLRCPCTHVPCSWCSYRSDADDCGLQWCA